MTESSSGRYADDVTRVLLVQAMKSMRECAIAQSGRDGHVSRCCRLGARNEEIG